MEEFLVLVYSDPANYQEVSSHDMEEEGMREIFSYMEKLAKGDHLISAQPLGKKANVLHPSGQITDGPYAETKEIVSGYFLIKAESFDKAVELSRKNPLAKAHKLEVRPVSKLHMPAESN